MLTKIKNKALALTIAGYFTILTTAPAPAAMVDSVFSDKSVIVKSEREANIDKIQRALENEIVKEKLKANGLDENQIKEKLSQMSDQQIHMLAQASDKVLAGGDAMGSLIGIFMLIMVLFLILKLTGKGIMIR